MFGKLISATWYGEQEVGSAPIPKRVVKTQQAMVKDKKNTKWANEFGAAMVREVKSAIASKPPPPAEPKHSREHIQ